MDRIVTQLCGWATLQKKLRRVRLVRSRLSPLTEQMQSLVELRTCLAFNIKAVIALVGLQVCDKNLAAFLCHFLWLQGRGPPRATSFFTIHCTVLLFGLHPFVDALERHFVQTAASMFSRALWALLTFTMGQWTLSKMHSCTYSMSSLALTMDKKVLQSPMDKLFGSMLAADASNNDKIVKPISSCNRRST